MPGMDLEDLAWLEALPAKLQEEVEQELDRATETAGDLIARDASARAPRRTGKLAESITADVEQLEHGSRAVVGSAVEYAPIIEFGLEGRRAQPFLGPAVDATEARVEALYSDALDRALDQVVKG